jgi:hypothetical protein
MVYTISYILVIIRNFLKARLVVIWEVVSQHCMRTNRGFFFSFQSAGLIDADCLLVCAEDEGCRFVRNVLLCDHFDFVSANKTEFLDDFLRLRAGE